jgi:hypothetical protein
MACYRGSFTFITFTPRRKMGYVKKKIAVDDFTKAVSGK